MPQAVCNGIQISYDDTEFGSSKRPLVFLHGHGFDRSMWDYQRQALRGSNRIITYDLRGHGRSEKPATGYGLEDEIKDLGDLLDVVKAPKAHLIGLSRGGRVALGFAATHPGRVASIITMGAGYDMVRHAPDFAEQNAQIVATLKAEGLRAAKAYRMGLPIFAPAVAKEEVSVRMDHLTLSYTGAHWLDENPPTDPSLVDMVSAITAPALIMVGDQDLPGFQACADELAEKIPGAEKRIVPGVGHMMNLEAPEIITEAVGSFVAKAST